MVPRLQGEGAGVFLRVFPLGTPVPFLGLSWERSELGCRCERVVSHVHHETSKEADFPMPMTSAERSARYRLKHGSMVRERAKLKQRERRALAKEAGTVKPAFPDPPSDPIAALCSWSRDKLKVPPGHPLEGQPLEIPDYGVSFLRDCLDPGINEALLCMARKNAKSAIIADLLLGFLVGPLRFAGFRAGVVSLNLAKASELHRQMHDISEASGLSGLQFLAWPRLTARSDSGSVEILPADRSSGMSSSFDLSIVDELGLLRERDRELINSMRSSTQCQGREIYRFDGPRRRAFRP